MDKTGNYGNLTQMRKRPWLGGMGVVVYFGLIFLLSSIPGSSLPSLPLSDKTIHFLLYMGFGLVLTYFLSNLKPTSSRIAMGIVTFFFITAYGLSDEIHQVFVPGRDFDMLDLFADATGGITGWLLVLYTSNPGKAFTKTEEEKSMSGRPTKRSRRFPACIYR